MRVSSPASNTEWRSVRYLAIILVSLLGLTVTSQAGATPRFLPHGTHLTVNQKVAYYERSIHKDQTAIAFIKSHMDLRSLQMSSNLAWYRAALHWHKNLLARWQAKLGPPHLGGVAGVQAIIRYVFGFSGSQAVEVSRCETGGTFWPGSHNGQYLGIFQMGSSERARYGDYSDAYGQARAAYAYFLASGSDWSPWECQP